MPPIALGLLSALLILGPSGIDPTNIGWNAQGDASTHYLGWCFFRNSPWHFPLGANPDYGLELGSSIFYSDSIPLLAFVFKAFARWLPTPFQYFGLWVLLCLLLQSLFAWRLLGSCSETRGVRLRLASLGLFLFSPPLLIRIGGHSALVGHWLILAALVCYATPHPRLLRYGWPALGLVASLVHSYLLVMVLALWFAHLIRRARATSLRSLALDALLMLGAGGFGLWQAGFFLVPVEPSSGYGEFGMNLLAPVNPDIYSWLLPPVAPPFLGFHEGYNFFGLGTLLLLPALLIPLARRRSGLLRGAKSHWPLALVSLALTLFAVTQHVALGTASITLPLPASLLRIAGTLRSSGRMFWPVYYVFLTGLVLLSVRAHGERVACLVLAAATGLQVADTSRGWWAHLHRHLAGTSATAWPSPLSDPFWQRAGSEYRVLRRVPVANSAPDYAVFAYYAAAYHMATNAAYLARIDAPARARAEQQTETTLASGGFDPETLYVLDPAYAARASETLNRETDLLARVNGYLVLAPGWRRHSHPGLVEPAALQLRDLAPGLVLDHELFFGDGADGARYLGSGWSQPEAWGVWSDAARAELAVPFDPRGVGALRLQLEVGALIADRHPDQQVDLQINGVQAATWHFNAETTTGWREVDVPAAATRAGATTFELALRFDVERPTSPAALGLSSDTRELGVALKRLKLSLAPRAPLNH